MLDAMPFKTALVFLPAMWLSTTVFGQGRMPVLHATSKEIKIRDGDDLQHGELVPSLRPDTYVAHPSRAPKKVIFYTNRDSLSFEVNMPGAKAVDYYDFVVILNNRDSCFQRVAFTNPNRVIYKSLRRHSQAVSDTLSFTLGTDHFIHLTGKINDSPPLDIIFDTGASLGVLSDGGRRKGAHLRDGNENSFEFGTVRIEQAPIKYNDSHGSLTADGILGYNAFENKLVEIDYDQQQMVIHHQEGQVDLSGYASLPMIYRGAAIFVEAVLVVNGKVVKALVLFDTGSKFSLSLTKGYCATHGLFDQMQEIGSRKGIMSSGQRIKSTTVLLPELRIGNFPLVEIPTDLENPSKGEGLPFNIAGNDALKRFNVVLDFQNGVIYVKPNGLTPLPYDKPFNQWYLVWIGAGLILLALFIGIRNKIRK